MAVAGGAAAFALGADSVRAGCALLLAALFGAIAWFSRALARRYVEEDRSPVLRALLHARERIALSANMLETGVQKIYFQIF